VPSSILTCKGVNRPMTWTTSGFWNCAPNGKWRGLRVPSVSHIARRPCELAGAVHFLG
jgi:hypothetical protein